VRAHLTIDGRAAGDAVAVLGPIQSGEAVFAGAPAGTAVAGSVEDPNGAQADNVRYALAGGAGPGVLVIGGGGAVAREGFYVQHALAAGESGGRGYHVTATSAAQLSAGATEARLASRSAVVLLSTRGLERRGREALAAYVRDGGGLL